MIESLKVLDGIRLNFSPEGLFTINLTLAFIMFGVALEIKIEHFKQVLLNPKSPIVGVISQFFLLPLMTFILIIIFNEIITPSIAMGMILVASCPGGNISNFMSAMAKGNAALSVSLTAIATLAAIILTPLNFAIWGGLYTNVVSHIDSGTLLQPLSIDPIEMFKTVFLLLGIPLVLGMWFNYKFPKLTLKITQPLKKISIILFMLIVILAFIKNYDHFIAHIKFIFLIVLLHNAIALTTGFTFASIMRRNVQDRRAITIETGIQNSGLALVLLFNPKIFPPELAVGGMAFIAAWWGIWHIISGLGISYVWSKIKID
ncbi:MAG: bile acid:sodium symporter family protein [Bacteroidales bacterium]|nr:bile acid:sodium symporter family protein [Bacteroidales bacterium]